MPIHRIALVAHDHRKQDLMAWSKRHSDILSTFTLYATGTTGKLLAQTLNQNVTPLLSGPLGGDQQLGAKIAEGEIDFLIFFWDPLAPMPHDPDIKALLRLATLWNVPIACNEATADLLISSPKLKDPSWQRAIPDFTTYQQRSVASLGENTAQHNARSADQKDK